MITWIETGIAKPNSSFDWGYGHVGNDVIEEGVNPHPKTLFHY